MPNTKSLLLIDDTAESLNDLYSGVQEYGYSLHTEVKPEKALVAIFTINPDVILLDLHFPDDELLPPGSQTTGEKLFSEIRIQFPNIPIVIFSEQLEKDVFALQSIGAAPYRYSKDQIERMTGEGKDWAEDLAKILDEAIAAEKIRPEEYEKSLGFVVGKTQKMLQVARQIIEMAPLNVPVFIEGETGTGKELVAKALAKLSGRGAGKFQALNCSGMHQETLESTLFGHEKGAFSGATERFVGAFESCNHGTLFLDEIQEMSSNLQNKLKRVLNDGTIRRMKGNEDIHLNTRIIAATNKPPATLIAEGKLQEDIYYRISTLKISLPPLRERFDDLEDLCKYLLASICTELNKQTVVLRNDVYEKLKKYSWPGNIRDLWNVLYSSVVNSRSNVLFASDIQIPNDSHVVVTTVGAVKTSGTESVMIQDDPGELIEEFIKQVEERPPGARYEYVKSQIPKVMMHKFFGALIARLGKNEEKVRSKDVANYLCGDSEKNTCAKIRRFLSDNNFHLKDR